MTAVRIIFLDFDGVLNHHFYFRTVYKPWCDEVYKDGARPDLSRHELDRMHLDPVAIGHLNALIEATGAKVVVSSVWRYGHTVEGLQALLDSRGFTGDVIGLTPVLHKDRGLEIQLWLDKTELEVTDFVIIDDDSDMAHLLPHWVPTDSVTRGFHEPHIQAAIDVLGGEREVWRRWLTECIHGRRGRPYYHYCKDCEDLCAEAGHDAPTPPHKHPCIWTEDDPIAMQPVPEDDL